MVFMCAKFKRYIRNCRLVLGCCHLSVGARHACAIDTHRSLPSPVPNAYLIISPLLYKRARMCICVCVWCVCRCIIHICEGVVADVPASYIYELFKFSYSHIQRIGADGFYRPRISHPRCKPYMIYVHCTRIYLYAKKTVRTFIVAAFRPFVRYQQSAH